MEYLEGCPSFRLRSMQIEERPVKRWIFVVLVSLWIISSTALGADIHGIRVLGRCAQIPELADKLEE